MEEANIEPVLPGGYDTERRCKRPATQRFSVYPDLAAGLKNRGSEGVDNLRDRGGADDPVVSSDVCSPSVEQGNRHIVGPFQNVVAAGGRHDVQHQQIVVALRRRGGRLRRGRHPGPGGNPDAPVPFNLEDRNNLRHVELTPPRRNVHLQPVKIGRPRQLTYLREQQRPPRPVSNPVEQPGDLEIVDQRDRSVRGIYDHRPCSGSVVPQPECAGRIRGALRDRIPRRRFLRSPDRVQRGKGDLLPGICDNRQFGGEDDMAVGVRRRMEMKFDRPRPVDPRRSQRRSSAVLIGRQLDPERNRIRVKELSGDNPVKREVPPVPTVQDRQQFDLLYALRQALDFGAPLLEHSQIPVLSDISKHRGRIEIDFYPEMPERFRHEGDNEEVLTYR
mgnify:CR=1 FL=1